MWIIEIMEKIVNSIIEKIVSGIVDKVSVIIDDIFKVAGQVVQGNFVTNIADYSYKLGISILIFLAISQVIKLYILNEAGDPENDFIGFFIRLGKTAIIMSFSTIIVDLVIDLSNAIGSDILNIVQKKGAISGVFRNDLGSLAGKSFGEAISIIILIIAILIALLVVSFQAGIRGVELAVMKMTAPLFMANYITTDKGLFKKWLQNLGAISLTYVSQLLLLNIALKYIGYGTGDIINSFIGICWLVVCIKSPKALKEIAYSSGVGSGMARGARAVGSTVMHMMK